MLFVDIVLFTAGTSAVEDFAPDRLRDIAGSIASDKVIGNITERIPIALS